MGFDLGRICFPWATVPIDRLPLVKHISEYLATVLTGNFYWCKSKSMQTKIMGILNITPDSFSDGGEYYNDPAKAAKRVEQMISEGADYIDIGGESTRPGSENVTEEEELQRVLPVITTIRKTLGTDIQLSIDTWKANVAQKSLLAGANTINSLGGFLFDEKLAEVVAKHHCTIIIYHIKGKPKTMQKGEITCTNVCKEVGEFFERQIAIGEKY